MAKEWTPKEERLWGTRWIAHLPAFIPRQRGQRPRLPAADASKAWHSAKNRLTLRAVFAYTTQQKTVHEVMNRKLFPAPFPLFQKTTTEPVPLFFLTPGIRP